MLDISTLIETNERLTDLLSRARIALQSNKTTVLHPKYKIVYADPPWSYNDQGCIGTMADHYSGMEIEDIKALPIRHIIDQDSILFLWITYPMIREGLDVIKAWGFTYKSIAFQWIKLNPKAGTPFYGLGRWTRGNTEGCFIATKGKPKRISKSVFQLIQTPRQEHSKKPDIVRDKIVELMGDLPRIELFATQRIEGWDCWGDQVDSDIVLSIPAPRKVIR